MRTFYQFWGGELNGNTYVRSEVEEMACGYTPDNSLKRARGILCTREELDKQPKVNGYLGPMYDGKRHLLKGGRMIYEFEADPNFEIVETVTILRYESQDVYNQLSN